MPIKYPKSTFLGASDVKAFPKVQYEKIVEIIDEVNDLIDGGINTEDLVVTGSLVTEVATFKHTASAINATATATAAQVATGLITSTSAAATGITLPSATALLTAIGGSTGTWFDLAVDNSAGANTVTITPSASITAATAVITGGATLTVASGAVGLFRIYFSSGTVAKIYRIG